MLVSSSAEIDCLTWFYSEFNTGPNPVHVSMCVCRVYYPYICFICVYLFMCVGACATARMWSEDNLDKSVLLFPLAGPGN